jgi:hypothetical protein
MAHENKTYSGVSQSATEIRLSWLSFLSVTEGHLLQYQNGF